MTKQTHTLLIRWKKKRIHKSGYVQEIKCFGRYNAEILWDAKDS